MIQSDDEIRIKIVGTRVDAKDIVSILGQIFLLVDKWEFFSDLG